MSAALDRAKARRQGSPEPKGQRLTGTTAAAATVTVRLGSNCANKMYPIDFPQLLRSPMLTFRARYRVKTPAEALLPESTVTGALANGQKEDVDSFFCPRSFDRRAVMESCILLLSLAYTPVERSVKFLVCRRAPGVAAVTARSDGHDANTASGLPPQGPCHEATKTQSISVLTGQ